MDPLTHGWTRRDGSTSLTPTTVADGVILAPDDILKMIKCSCGSTTPCKSKRCGCHNANMALYCDGCFNEKTVERIQADDGSDDDDDANDDD